LGPGSKVGTLPGLEATVLRWGPPSPTDRPTGDYGGWWAKRETDKPACESLYRAGHRPIPC
jgi:hypothetical protein